jgi:quercetin dioxygenase-like cupin family protein
MNRPSCFPRFRLFLLTSLLPLAALAGEGYTSGIKVQTLLRTETDAAGQPIRLPAGARPEFATLLVEIPAGQETGWHVHPSPCVAYVLEGEVAVETKDRGVRSFKAGDSFAEVVDLPHCGRNTGSKPVKILLVVVGQSGTPVSRPIPR